MAKKKQLSSDQYFDLCQHLKAMPKPDEPIPAKVLSDQLEVQLKMPVSASAVKRAVAKLGIDGILASSGPTLLELEKRVRNLEIMVKDLVMRVV